MTGFEFKVWRLKLGLKQYQLAARIGVPQTIIYEIEVGKRQPSPGLESQIYRVLKELENEKRETQPG